MLLIWLGSNTRNLEDSKDFGDERRTSDRNDFSSASERIFRNMSNSSNDQNSSTIKYIGYTRNISHSSCIKSTSESTVGRHISLETKVWMKIESSITGNGGKVDIPSTYCVI